MKIMRAELEANRDVHLELIKVIKEIKVIKVIKEIKVIKVIKEIK